MLLTTDYRVSTINYFDQAQKIFLQSLLKTTLEPVGFLSLNFKYHFKMISEATK